jgi:hypothetical protein
MDDLLLDGEGVSMEMAAKHAAGCEACLEKLTAWNEISSTARDLKASWNSDLLWPRIERKLKEETRKSSRSVWQIAAAAVLTIGIGASSWYAFRSASHDAVFGQHIVQVSALDEVKEAEDAHVAAIEKLERLAEPALEHSNAPLMITYKEKLMLLDDAIAECEAQIDENRQNAHLRKQLLAVYTTKQQTLEEVIREGNNASNQ